MLLSKHWRRVIVGTVVLAFVWLTLRRLTSQQPYAGLLKKPALPSAQGYFQGLIGNHWLHREQQDHEVEPASSRNVPGAKAMIVGPAASQDTRIGSASVKSSAAAIASDSKTPTPAAPGILQSVASPNKIDQIPSQSKPIANLSKTIVMGKLSSENTSWVTEELPAWQNAIYVVDLPPNATSPTGLRTKMNKAKEAMPYLTWIIDTYPHFPDIAVFLHAHRSGWPGAWHNEFSDTDAVHMLKALRLETVLKRGYVNLRCIHEPGCPAEVLLNAHSLDPKRYFEQIYPDVYADFFGISVEEVKQRVPVVATQCCAQFAVSREQLLQRPKSAYVHYRRFIEESELKDNVIGTVMEYMWHIIFGQDPVSCEEALKCYGEVYGALSAFDPYDTADMN